MNYKKNYIDEKNNSTNQKKDYYLTSIDTCKTKIAYVTCIGLFIIIIYIIFEVYRNQEIKQEIIQD